MSRVRLLTSLFLALALAFSSVALTGCGEEEESATVPSVGDDTGDPSGDNDFVVDQDQIFLDVASGGWTSLMHENTGISDSCAIVPDDSLTAAERYIECTLEVPELSAWFRNIDLAVNMPANTCRYTRVRPYWYANFDIGFHATDIYIESQTDGVGECLQYQCSNTGYGALTACNTSPAQAIADGDSWYIDGEGNPICLFDHAQIDSDDPDCCVGSYTLNSRTYDTVNTVATNTVSTVASFGTVYGEQCYGGPFSYEASWPKLNNQPVPLVINTWLEGMGEIYTLASPSSYNRYQYNTINGNYYSPGVGLPNPMSSTYANSIGQTGHVSPYEDYEVECLDEGDEVIYSIKLKIREWNTTADFNTYLASGTGDPDVSGVEGTNCEYEDPDDDQCNDRTDWDDLTNSFPAPTDSRHYPRSIW